MTTRYGSGFSLSNVTKMRKLYQTYPILQTLSAKLSWSHYVELLKIEDPLERSFYLKESERENALIDNLSTFLLELGKGFTYVGRLQRINIGGRIYKIDLVFYHRILKCFVLIDLKRGEVQHEDIGQMNLYLNYYREEMNIEGDTEPIGIVLGAYENKLMVKYATQNISNQLFVSRYQLYLPDREQLENEINRFLDSKEEN